MTAAMELHVALSLRLDAREAYRLAFAYEAEVLRKEASNLRRIEREETPEGALGTRTGLLRAALILDERADQLGEKATAPAATATPTPFIEDARLRTLHDAMRAQPGQWRTSHARRALREAGFKGLGRNTASQFLRALVEKGLAAAHGPEDGRFYTLSTSYTAPTGTRS